MKANITDLLIVFDELDEFATNEELGVYWFRFTRSDGLTISLSFSIYECYVDILVYIRDQVTISDVSMKNCSEIRILINLVWNLPKSCRPKLGILTFSFSWTDAFV